MKRNWVDRCKSRLANLGYSPKDGQSLVWEKSSRRRQPILRLPEARDLKFVIEIPTEYPQLDLKGHLSCPQLNELWHRERVKHVRRDEVDGEKVLSVCLRGAWNTQDFRNPKVVDRGLQEWIRDFNMRAEFPEDLYLPEMEIFGRIDSERVIYVDEGWMMQDSFYGFDSDARLVTVNIRFDEEAGLGYVTSINHPHRKKFRTPLGAVLISAIGVPSSLTDFFVLAFAGWDFPFRTADYIPPEQFKELLPFFEEKYRRVRAELKRCLRGSLAWGYFFELYGRRMLALHVVDMENYDERGPEYVLKEKSKFVICQNFSQVELLGRSGGLLNDVKAHVLAVGLGAIGSQAAVLMAQAGIKSLKLVDPDRLRPGNVMRHAASLKEVGRYKVEAVKDLLISFNPYINVSVIPQRYDSAYTDDVDFITSTVADDTVDLEVNRDAVQKGIPAVYGRTNNTSCSGRVIRVVPRRDACLKCLSTYNVLQDTRYPMLPCEDVEQLPDIRRFRGCTSPSFVGANLDVQLYANSVARETLRTLGSLPPNFYGHEDFNHLVITARATGLDRYSEDSLTFHKLFFHPLPACPVCGDVSLPYRAIVVTSDVWNTISAYASQAGSCEVGGALIGMKCTHELLYEDDFEYLLVLHATGPGPHCKRTEAQFDWDAAYVTNEVARFFELTDGKCNYIGDWHTHPNPPTAPSWTDNTTMLAAVGNPTVKLPALVSIIVAASDPSNRNTTVYTIDGRSYTEFPLEVRSENLNLPFILDDLSK